MLFKYNDGGAAEAGYTSTAGDCVLRSLVIAADSDKYDYATVRKMILEAAKDEKPKKPSQRSRPRDGVTKETTKRVAEQLGLIWIPLMKVGKGCKHRLHHKQLPMTKRPYAAAVSRHMTAVHRATVYDTYDCSRDGSRCVYGLYVHKEDYDSVIEQLPSLETTPSKEKTIVENEHNHFVNNENEYELDDDLKAAENNEANYELTFSDMLKMHSRISTGIEEGIRRGNFEVTIGNFETVILSMNITVLVPKHKRHVIAVTLTSSKVWDWVTGDVTSNENEYFKVALQSVSSNETDAVYMQTFNSEYIAPALQQKYSELKAA